MKLLHSGNLTYINSFDTQLLVISFLFTSGMFNNGMFNC